MNKPILCCFRIKAATLVLGIFDLMAHMILLVTLCATMSRPNYEQPFWASPPPAQPSPMPPQRFPFSNVNTNGGGGGSEMTQTLFNVRGDFEEMLRRQKDLNDQVQTIAMPSQQLQPASSSSSTPFSLLASFKVNSYEQDKAMNSRLPADYFLFSNIYIMNRQDKTIAFLVTCCSSIITMMLIYGIVKNRPSYLMPYFSIKVFQAIITCLTTLGFYSCLPDLRRWIQMHHMFPFKDLLLSLDKNTLDLFVFVILFMVILGKLYVVTLVWYCYKYMMTMESFPDLMITTTANGGSVIIGGCSSSENENNTGFKIDDESLLVYNGMPPPPSYSEIVKQIKRDQHPESATTSTDTTETVFPGNTIISTEEIETSHSQTNEHPAIVPPSYSVVVVLPV